MTGSTSVSGVYAQDVSAELADELCLDADQAARLLDGSQWRRFAVLGDSFAAGTGDSSDGYEQLTWPERVERALRAAQPDLAYLNTGRIGARTAQVIDEQLAEVVGFAPDLACIAVGGNDLFVDEPDYDAIESGLERLYSTLAGAGADIVVFTVANVFDAIPALAVFRDRMAELNARTTRVAGRHGASVVDMWEHPVRLRTTVMSQDGVHFAHEGQAALASEIIKALATRLGGAP